ncbi:MAG: YihY/virulence factor BrkB family protein [Anaerolineales bacterium]
MSKSESVIKFLKELYHIWVTERPSTLAAALAYYSLFSFAPVIFIALTIASLFIDVQALVGEIINRVESTLGAETAQYIQETVFSISQTTTGGSTLTTLIGYIALIFAASMLFFQLQYALNTIWEVPPAKKQATLALIKSRLMSFLMVIGLGFLMIVATVASIIVSFLQTYIDLGSPVSFITLIAVFGLMTISIALVYKYLPDVDINWGDVGVGSIVTAVLLAMGGWLLGIYFTYSNIASAVAVAGAVAVLLIAFYIFAQIFLFGAVFTRVYASMFGSKIVPEGGDDSPADESPVDKPPAG